MKFAEATSLHRKSGGAKDLLLKLTFSVGRKQATSFDVGQAAVM
jgi:hypothetical protein